MKRQNASWFAWGSLIALACSLLLGCSHAASTDSDDNAYPDTDTDSDSDSNSDMDSDSDSDSDMDSATETDSSDTDSESDSDTSEIIYESGIYDPSLPDLGGPAISDTQYLASRFTITSPVRVTKIGGHMNIFFYGPDSLFGAIVRTDGAFPTGTPWQEEEMVAQTLFDKSMGIQVGVTTDHWIPLDVELDPGFYAIVFGCYTLECAGYMSEQSEDTPEGEDSYVKWDPTNGWFNSNSSSRFVVKGEYL